MKDFILLVAIAIGVSLILTCVVVLMVLSAQTPQTRIDSSILQTPATSSHESFNDYLKTN